MKYAVKFEAISKQYRLGEVGTGTLSHDLHRAWARVRGKPDPFGLVGQENDRTSVGTPQKPDLSKGGDYVWALKDVSFDVKQGQVLGIIGRNGAGKSTLLKILSRVTAPSSGVIKVRGRIASLLEVGTGFHPELTGRENIFLNGTILGMRKAEIRRKLDEIVDFSGCGRYVDTPVKRYSSGMYVRLAFAVAAHLEPEVLVIDEVLAVGDAEFQRKCIGKMKEVAGDGRTVLFVSHNMAAVENLCAEAVLLQAGRLTSAGPAKEIVAIYLRDVLKGATKRHIGTRSDRKGSGELKIVDFWLADSNGERVPVLRSGQDVRFMFEFECREGQSVRNVTFSFAIRDEQGVSLILHRTNYKNQDFDSVPERGRFCCEVRKLPLAHGNYLLGTYAEINGSVADDPGVIAEFEVEQGDFFGTGRTGLVKHSPILIDGNWSVSRSD